MTELKTLKDLILKINHEDIIDYEELKAEAVKWFEFHNDKDIYLEGDEQVKSFIMHFFNLTEEDLTQLNKTGGKNGR